MSWQRLGRLFHCEGLSEWMHSHAANPFVEPVAGDRYRVYFNVRDKQNRSAIARGELDMSRHRVTNVEPEPVLHFSEAGEFAKSGVSLGCIVPHDGDRYLYYVGWTVPESTPWRNTIGLAISTEDGPFIRYASTPVVGLSETDPQSLSYPWVTKEDSIWRMWYGSNVNWGRGDRDLEHVLKYAESHDGVHWDATGAICLAAESDDSYAYSRPCVIHEGGVYKMWYSYRGRHYRIGYAESLDGIRWQRKDDLGGILPSGVGWDSDSVEYAHVFDHRGRRFAAYCGNGYGRSGFGLAVLERESWHAGSRGEK